jgi:hypothetical protein
MAKTEIDYSALNALLQFKVTCNFCADYLKTSRDTLIRRIREDHDMSFAEYHSMQMENTSVKLQQKAISMGLAGNATLLTFCLKNLSKWADKQDINAHVQDSRIKIDKEDEGL